MTEFKTFAAPGPTSGLAKVVLVGRPNVGKSTLFNRLVGRRRALVHDLPGVTRDRLEAEVTWAGRRFCLVDTGGLTYSAEGELHASVEAQTSAALAEADLVLLVVDAREGPTPLDKTITERLFRGARQALLVVNKAEGRLAAEAPLSFAELGLGMGLAVSSEHGEGSGELLDAVVEHLPPETTEALVEAPAEEAIELAIVGRPNVGKSLLFNRLTGLERAIVSPVAGTTRDALDVMISFGETRLRLVDTAGLRRKGRKQPGPEALSAVMTLKSIEKAQVVIVLLDASQPIAHQDSAIAGLVVESGRAAVLALNKCDRLKSDRETKAQVKASLRASFKFMAWAPAVAISALKGTGLESLIEAVIQADRAHRTRLTTGELNRFIGRELKELRLETEDRREARILYAAQVATRPPRFVFQTNRTPKVHFSKQRLIENRLRAHYEFRGTPLRLSFRARSH